MTTIQQKLCDYYHVGSSFQENTPSELSLQERDERDKLQEKMKGMSDGERKKALAKLAKKYPSSNTSINIEDKSNKEQISKSYASK